jgi:hypothetical protein
MPKQKQKIIMPNPKKILHEKFPNASQQIIWKEDKYNSGSNGRGTLTEQPVWDGAILTHYMLAGQKFSSDS